MDAAAFGSSEKFEQALEQAAARYFLNKDLALGVWEDVAKTIARLVGVSKTSIEVVADGSPVSAGVAAGTTIEMVTQDFEVTYAYRAMNSDVRDIAEEAWPSAGLDSEAETFSTYVLGVLENPTIQAYLIQALPGASQTAMTDYLKEALDITFTVDGAGLPTLLNYVLHVFTLFLLFKLLVN